MPQYAELTCRSNFSFLEGASFPEELVQRARQLGLSALALTDRDGVYGLVRAHRRARELGLHLVSGATLSLDGLPALVLLVQNRQGWANLCRILTEGRRNQPKGVALHEPELVLEHHQGLVALLHGPWTPQQAAPFAKVFEDRAFIALSLNLLASDEAVVAHSVALSRFTGMDLLACGNVHMHRPQRRQLLDALTCIRRKTTIDRAGRALAPNAQRVLQAPARVYRRFGRVGGRALEEAVERTVKVARSCTFTLDQLRYSYPHEVVPQGYTPMSWLRELGRRGLAWRYPEGAPARVRRQVERELAIIDQLGYPAYFLTVHDLVDFARKRGILCQGRGSAANSALCFALGITSVDPARSNLLFERFISPERDEPPDIDVDFEHERREEVIQYAYRKYGRHRAAMVNEVISYRPRSAVRDLGKAMGLSPDQVDRLARGLDRWGREPVTGIDLAGAGLDPGDNRVALTLELVEQIRGFPRHVSIHTGGMVLTDDHLVEKVPVEPASMKGRTVIQWDKDDIDHVGFVKVDLLALGMLTAIRKCFDLVAHWPVSGARPCGVEGSRQADDNGSSPPAAEPFSTPTAALGAAPPGGWSYGLRWSMARIPPEDPAVYDMLCKADTMGVFQVESRAQMSMLPRLRPRCFYDLVIEISLVRPGPIQGGMVHPYLSRRRGDEPVSYPHPALEPILERTLGIPIFQEQVMAIAVAVAGFTPGQADQLRRAMGAWRKKGTLGPIARRLYKGLREHGIDGEHAQRIVQQIQGFGEYGFPESHAASFSLLVYVSAWLRLYYPAAFAAALINSQPMGFYSPASLVADARRHGVRILPIDVNHSNWDCSLESTQGVGDPCSGSSHQPEKQGSKQGPALRLGLRLVAGLGQSDADRLEAARRQAPFRDLADMALRSGLGRGALRKLAHADAFISMGLRRRRALWAIDGLWNGPLLAGLCRSDSGLNVGSAGPIDEMRADYRSTGLSLRAHPIGIIRRNLDERGIIPADRLAEQQDGGILRVAGMVSCRQRPATASGMVFLTLEDETGMVNVAIRPRVYKRQRRLIREASLLEIMGRLQRQDQAISLLAYRVFPVPEAVPVNARSRDFH